MFLQDVKLILVSAIQVSVENFCFKVTSIIIKMSGIYEILAKISSLKKKVKTYFWKIQGSLIRGNSTFKFRKPFLFFLEIKVNLCKSNV